MNTYMYMYMYIYIYLQSTVSMASESALRQRLPAALCTAATAVSQWPSEEGGSLAIGIDGIVYLYSLAKTQHQKHC